MRERKSAGRAVEKEDILIDKASVVAARIRCAFLRVWDGPYPSDNNRPIPMNSRGTSPTPLLPRPSPPGLRQTCKPNVVVPFWGTHHNNTLYGFFVGADVRRSCEEEHAAVYVASRVLHVFSTVQSSPNNRTVRERFAYLLLVPP